LAVTQKKKINYNEFLFMLVLQSFQLLFKVIGLSKELPNTRIAPNRRWFGNTRVVGQNELERFREAMGQVSPHLTFLVVVGVHASILLMTEAAAPITPTTR
jgi:hypothetical protein